MAKRTNYKQEKRIKELKKQKKKDAKKERKINKDRNAPEGDELMMDAAAPDEVAQVKGRSGLFDQLGTAVGKAARADVVDAENGIVVTESHAGVNDLR